jgi:hypothetical protein
LSELFIANRLIYFFIYFFFILYRIEGFSDVPFPEKPLDMVENMVSPRFIKSHLPVALLPDQLWTVKPKIVYIRRNPKDTAVSFFHHHRLLHGYKGDLNDFMDAFIDDLILYCIGLNCCPA